MPESTEQSPTPQRPLDERRVNLRELPPEVVQARSTRADDDAECEPVARPRIEANLTACKLVLQQLEAMHRNLADVTDLDLTGYSRASALWLLAGRCLGLLRAVLVQVEAGVCTEAVVTGRAIHEATQVLLVFGDAGQDELLRIWLDDEGKHSYVKPGAAREAQDVFEAKLDEAMQRMGAEPLRRTKEVSAELYDRMSRVAHNRRSGVVDALWEPGRQMAYGVHPSPIRQAAYAGWAGTMTVAVTHALGDALAPFYEAGFIEEHITPLLESIEAVRQTAPLDPDSIRREAGTAPG